jgi:Protein of unknown function (DUF2846)
MRPAMHLIFISFAKNIQKVLLLLTIVGLIGCVSMPNFTEYAHRLPPPGQGEGRIWFYRQSRFVGGGIQPSVLLNGEKIGKARPGGYFYVDRPAGNYVITCETEQINECRLVLEPGSTKYVRLTMGVGVWIASIVPQEVSRMTALQELADL